MLEDVKRMLRITTNVFDAEISDLISAAAADLGIAGILEDGAAPTGSGTDALIRTAIATYVKLHFGHTDDYDRLKASYDEQKAQLQTATGYTDWGDD